MNPLPLASPGEVKTAELNVPRLARRASLLPRDVIEIRVRRSPRTKLKVNPLKKRDILAIVTPHDRPGFWITGHAAEPQVFARVGKLPADAEIMAKIVKLVGVELKEASCQLEGINALVRRWRFQPIGGKTSVRLAKIMAISIVGDYDICLVQYFPELLDEFPIGLFVFLKGGEVWEGVTLDRLGTLPLDCEGKKIPVGLKVDDVLFPLPPNVA